MKKRILASLLVLAMLITPVTAFGQTVTVPADAVGGAIMNVSQFMEVHEGRAYFGLRRVAEAYLGPNSVSWNQAAQTITISFSGADVAARLGADIGVDLSDVVRPGVFSIDLRRDGDSLVVANGPAAGTRLVVSFINDRHMIPATHFTREVPNNVEVLYANANLATNLIQTALENLTGRSVSYSVAPGGITLELN